MALVMPSEIQTERMKISHHPVVMIDISGKSIYLASENFTLDLSAGGSRTYGDYLKEKSSIKIKFRIPERFGSLAGIATADITLVDWDHFKGTLVGTGTGADLTDENIEIYLKFKTSNNDEANRVLLFKGFIKTYTETKGILKLNAEGNYFDRYGSIPNQTLIDYDSDSIAEKDVAVPLQYGDFSWGNDLKFWADTEKKLAVCPYLKRDSVNQKHIFLVAKHTMKNLPAASDLTDVRNFKAFIRRNDQFLPISGTSVTVNTSTPVNIKVGSLRPYYFLVPSELYTSDPDYDNTSDAENVLDGKQSTYSDLTVDPSNFGVIVHNLDVVNISDDFSGLGIDVNVYVDVSGSSGSVVYFRMRLRKKSDDSIVDTYEITSNVTGWVHKTFDIDATLVNNYYIELSSSVYADTCNVYDLFVLIAANHFDISRDEKALYLVAQGRSFSGDWDGRRTSGDLIEHPVDMVESIFRDEMGITDIDTGSFDTVKALHTWKINSSIFIQNDADQLFQNIAYNFGYGIGFRANGKVFIAYPTNALKFSQSGTDTPANSDIVKSNESVSGNSFVQNPFLLDSFNLDRSPASDKRTKVIVSYWQTYNRNLIKQSQNGSGYQILTLDNYFVQDKNTADSIALALTSIWSKQRYLAKFQTFFTLLWGEIGDVINLQHIDLPDTLLSASQSLQKWIVYSVIISLLDGLVQIQTLEL